MVFAYRVSLFVQTDVRIAETAYIPFPIDFSFQLFVNGMDSSSRAIDSLYPVYFSEW